MAPSISNENGSTNPKDIPYGNHLSFPWVPFPEYGGAKSTIYRSADGKIVAAAAKETGTAKLTYPCDEFFYVTSGWIKLDIEGGDDITLKTGDFIYLTKGTTVNFTFGDDFANVAVFIDTEKVTLV